MATQSIPPALSLTELANAQKNSHIFACDLGEEAEKLQRLQNIYARKRAELAAVRDLFTETTPDLVLRTADGRQIAVRLPDDDGGQVFQIVHEVLSEGLRSLEQEIVNHLIMVENEAVLRKQSLAKWNSPADTLRAPILALCAPNDPAIAALASREWDRRTTAAEAQEEEMQKQYQNEHTYGREILWHPLFPEEYVACVSKLPLAEVTVMQGNLASWCNQDRPLDRYDYAYLADVLREALASQPIELTALRLRRALAYIEQASALLLPTSWPAAMPSQPTLATAA